MQGLNVKRSMRICMKRTNLYGKRRELYRGKEAIFSQIQATFLLPHAQGEERSRERKGSIARGGGGV